MFLLLVRRRWLDFQDQLYTNPIVHNDGVMQEVLDCNKLVISHGSKKETLCHPKKEEYNYLGIIAHVENGREVSEALGQAGGVTHIKKG